jgi:tetratricopeptide (TPR) repeat protein
VALNRVGEAVEPLRSLLGITPPAERISLIEALPRFFGRNERSEAPGLLAQVLQGHLEAPETRVAAQVALGRAWLGAAEPAKALEAAQRAHAWAPAAEGPALLALEMLPQQAAAEPIVAGHLAAKPDSHGVRLLYARMLTGAQRYGDAVTQLEALTRAQPDLAPPWLTLGALQVELRQSQQATTTLKRFVELIESTPAGPATGSDDETAGGDRGLTQAWLLLAQAAEQQRDYAGAEAWLARIDDPQRALDVQLRRASLLVRQSRLADARALIQRLPEKPPVDARAKLLAEAQLLRDARQWTEAYKLLGDGAARFTGDVDLLYEQSMMAEKMNRLDDMERLLRRVIELKPDHHHAYNALGYSLADRGLRLPEAKALIQKALSLSPGEPFITDSLGWVEYRLGNRDEALRLLREAYRARPDVEIAAHLGEVLWVMGDRAGAETVWSSALKQSPDSEVLLGVINKFRGK